MNFGMRARAIAAALALALAGCSGGGSEVASPGSTSPGTAPGGGGGGGGGGTGGGSAACPTGTVNAGALGAFTVCSLSGEVLTNLTLPVVSGVVYRMSGRVDIGRDLGGAGSQTGGQSATLTISPGVTLFGDEAGDMMIVNRGSRIVANGTQSQPIVFTSREDVLGLNDPTTANRQWGGLIVLGRAPIKGCNVAVASGSVDCQNAVEGVTAATGRAALYGGATPTDTSGSLQFVQVRYPGAFLTSATLGDDLNGITMAGVGSGTIVDNIQVHNSGDDGIEVFGGRVNMRHVVITGAFDDSLDYDEGWNGKVQFLAIRQSTITGGVDKMIEGSNRAVAGTGGGEQTNPTISNFTFVGVPLNGATQLIGIDINNTSGTPGASTRFLNGVVTGSRTCARTDTAATSPAVRFDSIMFDCPNAVSATTLGVINAGANNTQVTSATLAGVLPGPNELSRNATAVNPTTVDPTFTAGSYVGAFSPTETATSNWAAGWTFQLFATTGCPTGTTEGGTIAGARRCVVQGAVGVGSVPTNLRLTAGNIYEISGRVDVGVDIGGNGTQTGGLAASLTIDPGVTLYGDGAADMLVVNRGSQIFVNGTPSAPVIMTSLADITNAQADPINASREWAGLIVLGRAQTKGCNVNVPQGDVTCQNAIEGVTAATGRAALYGGATNTDNSGRITYLQIRYPGAFLTSATLGDDLNGLTLGSVGSGTVINNVQVHNSGDDGIEVFGGRVNMKNIIITGAVDDSLDYDEGWTGNVQYALIVQSATGIARDRLVEASNRQVASAGNALQTRPSIANFTFVGVPTNGATALIGVDMNNTSGTPGSSGRYVNGVVIGSTTCLRTDTAATGADAPTVNSTLLDCPGALSTASAATVNAGANNSTTTANTLSSAAAGGRPFINGSAETARTAVNPQTAFSDVFFDATTYVGAVRNSSDTWWQSWSCGLNAGSSC